MSERCGWCGDDPLYVAYHDEEWGVPEYDGRALWEKLVLDGFQAGLAWITILRKRDNFRAAFEGFDPEVIARWGETFKNRVFLASEQAYCDARPFPSRHYAGRFAVKEALTKAFGTGVSVHIGWLDIEVVRDRLTGAPSAWLLDKGAHLARRRRIAKILISLSHTRAYAVAHALLLGDAGEDLP